MKPFLPLAAALALTSLAPVIHAQSLAELASAAEKKPPVSWYESSPA